MEIEYIVCVWFCILIAKVLENYGQNCAQQSRIGWLDVALKELQVKSIFLGTTINVIVHIVLSSNLNSNCFKPRYRLMEARKIRTTNQSEIKREIINWQEESLNGTIFYKRKIKAILRYDRL